jgi:hypothetical protein
VASQLPQTIHHAYDKTLGGPPCGVPIVAHSPDRRLCGVVVIVNESAEDWAAVHGRDFGFVRERLRPGWVKLLSAVRTLSVVVLDVLAQDRYLVTFSEDQHAVGEFGSDRADERSA